MKKKRNLYVIALVCFITLVGVTIAYLQSTSVFENIFNAGTYKTITHEEFIPPTNWVPGDETSKIITTKNEGTIPVRVRVKLDESWTSKNGNSLRVESIFNRRYALINLDNVDDWFYSDGYYYYLKDLNPGETTTSPLKSITFNPAYKGNIQCTNTDNTSVCGSTGNGYDGATYKIDITTETVQANKYIEIWGIDLTEQDYVGDNPCTYAGDVKVGTQYVNGQYTYTYRMYKNNYLNDLGWDVILTDKDSTAPVTTPLCSSINNKPIVSMVYMFSYSKASSIDFSQFDTSNVTDMRGMFNYSYTPILDLRSFDTSKAKYMTGMFQWSTSNSIDVSSFDTSNVSYMSHMFSHTNITSIDISNFNTSNVEYMNGMFGDSKITSLNLNNFDTSKVIDMNWMFAYTSLNSIDLSSFDMSNVTDTGDMFKNAVATTGYARTQADADILNASSNKPSGLTFVVNNN